ncbi:biliverdin-producing heme oxygenase [Flindersiella endophytica]
MVDVPFSIRIRMASRELHAEAHDSTFVSDLLDGRLDLCAYARYTAQLWHVYRALESAPPADPLTTPFVRSELLRQGAIEADLAFLLGPDWELSTAPLPTTIAYVSRIREVASTWPGGYLAHHYTRYLGDLSGGQVVRAMAERAWGLAHKGDGVRFYVFDEIGNPAAFKREYRAALDALPVDEVEQQRIIDECKRAFRCNIAMLDELARALAISA